jgi:hypothetical protein
MTRETATALAAFINGARSGTRAEPDGGFHAVVLPIGDREAWVIIEDRDHGGAVRELPPIVDVATYLTDARVGDRISPECRALMEAWLSRQTGFAPQPCPAAASNATAGAA